MAEQPRNDVADPQRPSNVLAQMTGAPYRVGLHHKDGTTSVSLSAHPVRFTVGELSAR